MKEFAVRINAQKYAFAVLTFPFESIFKFHIDENLFLYSPMAS